MNMIQTAAFLCHCAQEHIDCPDGWGTHRNTRHNLLQCTSYQIACLLAQHTVMGDHGVGWDVIINELVEHPAKSAAMWENILNHKASELGGWKIQTSIWRPMSEPPSKSGRYIVAYSHLSNVFEAGYDCVSMEWMDGCLINPDFWAEKPQHPTIR